MSQSNDHNEQELRDRLQKKFKGDHITPSRDFFDDIVSKVDNSPTIFTPQAGAKPTKPFYKKPPFLILMGSITLIALTLLMLNNEAKTTGKSIKNNQGGVGKQQEAPDLEKIGPIATDSSENIVPEDPKTARPYNPDPDNSSYSEDVSTDISDSSGTEENLVGETPSHSDKNNVEETRKSTPEKAEKKTPKSLLDSLKELAKPKDGDIFVDPKEDK